MRSALKPSVSLLCKLASMIVHYEESTSSDGHLFDKYALESLLRDPEVHEWLAAMRKLSLIPEKRS